MLLSLYNLTDFPPKLFSVHLDSLEEASMSSHQSFKSIDSVGTVELHVLTNIRHPPKNLILATTAIMILIAPGQEVGL